MILKRSSVGTAENTLSIRDLSGSGLLPVQVVIDAGVTATYRILGKVDPSLPWFEIREPASAEFLEAISFVPFLQLDVTAMTGSGSVTLGIAEG